MNQDTGTLCILHIVPVDKRATTYGLQFPCVPLVLWVYCWQGGGMPLPWRPPSTAHGISLKELVVSCEGEHGTQALAIWPVRLEPQPCGCGSKPVVPFWGRCTTYFSLF